MATLMAMFYRLVPTGSIRNILASRDFLDSFSEYQTDAVEDSFNITT